MGGLFAWHTQNPGSDIYHHINKTWWNASAIRAFRRCRLEDQELKVIIRSRSAWASHSLYGGGEC